MSTRGGNTIIRDGLAFHMDPADQNCWRGEPTANLVYNPDGSYNYLLFSGLSTTLSVTTLISGEKWRLYASAGIGAIRASFGLGLLIDGEYYTVSYKYRRVSGDGSFFATDWCDRSISRVTDNRDSYVYEYVTGFRSTYDTTYRFLDFTLTVGTSIEIWDVQLEHKPYPTPFIKGTRGSTVETGGGVIDLSGYKNDSLLTGGVGFKADNKGILVFNNVADYIGDSQFSVGADPEITISMWIRRTSTIQNGGFWGLGGNGSKAGICGYTYSQNKIGWDLWGNSTFHTGQDYPLNEWVYVCWVKTAPTFTTDTLEVYINGAVAPLTTIYRNNSSVVNLVDGYCFGNINMVNTQYGVKGEIGTSSIYNRALTPSEILQNFNATRARYGI